MNRLFLVLALSACGPIDIRPEAVPCENVDLADEPSLQVTRDGDDVLVSRLPIFVGDADVFSPDLMFDGNSILVTERWVENEESESDVCRSATLRLINPPQREFVVEWYLGNSVVPDERVRFKLSDL